MNESATMNTTEAIHEMAQKECVACQSGVPALRGPALNSLWRKLDNDWHVVNEHHLEKEFKFNDFREALEFTNRVGALAEEQNHHPDIYLSWGLVRITLFSHKVDGLTESDFVLAAKIQELKP